MYGFDQPMSLIFDLCQIFLLAVPLYFLLKFLRRTRGYRILVGIVLLTIGMRLVSRFLQMDEIGWMLDRLATYLPLSLVIIFQPELRRIFAEIGSRTSPRPEKAPTDIVREITTAIDLLASQKIGALVAIERGVSLDHYTKVARMLNAPVVAELLATLFYPHTPMHDGGVIIREGMILCAGCVFPLGTTMERRKAFGTRHRAAIGLSEETDAIVLVVSEETGLISVAYGGEILRGVETDGLYSILESGMGSRDERTATESISAVRESTDSPESVDKVAEAIARIKEET